MSELLVGNEEATLSKFDIAISYAGEQGCIARKLSNYLIAMGFRVFDYKVTPIDHNGHVLQERLKRLYSQESHTVILLLSRHYFGPTKKNTTRVEFEAAKIAEAEQVKSASNNYILPALLDRISLPSLPKAGTYYDLSNWQEPNAILWYANYISDHIKIRQCKATKPEGGQNQFNVMMVSPEYEGYNQQGGLGTAVAGLAQGLAGMGHSVRVLVPTKLGDEEEEKLPLPKEDQVSIETLLRERREGDVTLCWIESQEVGVFNYSYSSFPGNSPSQRVRAKILNLLEGTKTQSKKSLQQIRRFSEQIPHVLDILRKSSGWCPQVVHLHDWPTCYVPVYARYARPLKHSPRIVITIHNASHAGPLLPECGYTLLELGLRHADKIITVSPNYATNLLNGHPCVSGDVLGIIQRKGITGIVNGIDYDRLSSTPLGFSEMSDKEILEWKKSAKKKLRERLGIKAPETALQITFMHRCTEQKGFPEVMDAMPMIQQIKDLQLLIVGPQENWWECVHVRFLRGRAKGIPKFITGEEKLLVLAGSDVILMPSRFEPCGLTHLEGMYFGAVPLVTYVDGLADTVVPFNGEKGNALLIDVITPQAIAAAIQYAVKLYRQKSDWVRLVRNAISEDYSWDGPRKSLAEYQRIYSETISESAKTKDTFPATRTYKSGRRILMQHLISNRWKLLAVLLLSILWLNIAKFGQVYHSNLLNYHLSQMYWFIQDNPISELSPNQEKKFNNLKYYLGQDSYHVTVYSSWLPWEDLARINEKVELGGRAANWPVYSMLTHDFKNNYTKTWGQHDNRKSSDCMFWLVDTLLVIFAVVLFLLPKYKRIIVEPLPGRPHLSGDVSPSSLNTESGSDSTTTPSQDDSKKFE